MMTPMQRFAAKIKLPTDPTSDDCWMWTGGTHNGFGHAKEYLTNEAKREGVPASEGEG